MTATMFVLSLRDKTVCSTLGNKRKKRVKIKFGVLIQILNNKFFLKSTCQRLKDPSKIIDYLLNSAKVEEQEELFPTRILDLIPDDILVGLRKVCCKLLRKSEEQKAQLKVDLMPYKKKLIHSGNIMILHTQEANETH